MLEPARRSKDISNFKPRGSTALAVMFSINSLTLIHFTNAAIYFKSEFEVAAYSVHDVDADVMRGVMYDD